MPTFFDPDNLTPEQSARWEQARLEYARVQEANLDQGSNWCATDGGSRGWRSSAIHPYPKW